MLLQPPTHYQILGANMTPLTFKEELECLRRWKKTSSKKHRDKLIANYFLFSVKKTGRMYGSLNPDDILTIAADSVFDAIRKYDLNRGSLARLSTLIPFYIKQNYRILRKNREVVRAPELKSGEPRMQTIHGADESYTGAAPHTRSAHQAGEDMDGFLFDKGNPEVEGLEKLFGLEESASDIELRKEQYAALMAIFKQLPPILQECMRLVYFDGLSFAGAAERVSKPVTRERIRQRHVEAIKFIRQKVAQNDIFKRS